MSDGKVIISTELDNSGLEKDVGGLKEELGGAESAVQGLEDAAKEATDALSQVSQTAQSSAKGVSDAFGGIKLTPADIGQIRAILEDTQRSAQSKAASIAAIYRKQGLSMSEAMKKAWADVKGTSKAAAQTVGKDIKKHIGESVKEVTGALGGLKNVLGRLTMAVTSAFALRQVVSFCSDAVDASTELSNALQGLQSILEGQGRSFSDAQAFVEEYVSDGLIPAANAITAYKNLAARGYDDTQIRNTLLALKDAAAFGRQASYSIGEAVQSATEGLKNENSVLVDNAGVTKNVAKMWEEYATSIGTTANNLTQQQKIQAEVNGILEESKYQAGDAAKVAGTYSGQVAQLSYNFNALKVAIGNAIIPIAQQLLPIINNCVIAMTDLANAVAAVVSNMTGSVTTEVSSENAQIAKNAKKGAEAEKELEKSITAAGKAAKKSLAKFDELNRLQDSSGSSGGSTGGSSTTTGQTVTGGKVFGQDLEEAKDKVNGLVSAIGLITAALGGLKLGSFLAELLTANVKAENLKDTLLLLGKKGLMAGGTAFSLVGVALETKGIVDAIEEGLNGVSFTEILSGGGILAGGAAMIGQFFGNALLGGAIGGIVAGVPAFITGVYDAIVGGIDWLNAALTAAGGAAAGAGVAVILTSLGTAVAPGIGTLIGLAVGLVTDLVILIVQKWDEICAFFAPAVTWLDENVIQPVANFFSGLWSSISTWASDSWEGIKEFFAPAGEWFSQLFGSIGQTVEDIFYNIGVLASGAWEIVKAAWSIAADWVDEKIIQPVAGFFQGLWENVTAWAQDAWLGITEIFGKVAGFFSDIFSEAWGKVVAVFSPLGEVFVEIKDAIVAAFKTIVNGIIGGINAAVSKPFNGINEALTKLKGVSILGMTPFEGLKTISVPQIPYLAKGAVLPANKPFLAMVGDQKHGTNVEAPLSTIEEAVENALSRMQPGGGNQQIVELLQAILEAVLGIELDGEVLTAAVERHQNKMAVVKGR